MESLFLVVGLGNPGLQYARTRHNAGFLVVEELAKRFKSGWDLEKKFNARLAKGQVGSQRVLLMQPQTFMNLSGEAVSAAMSFYRLPLDETMHHASFHPDLPARRGEPTGR